LNEREPVSSPSLQSESFVILYVEDNALVRESVADVLSSPLRRFVCVGTRASALDVLGADRVDLLLTDVNLPDGSGLDLAREALQRDPSMPVILCSGDDLSSALPRLGPTAHALRKPFDFDEIEALLDRLAVHRS
jgi:CheY-like chemotaxis protein